MKNISKVREAINKVVQEALDEAHGTDPMVEACVGGIVNELALRLEGEDFASNAYEMVAGTPMGHDHDQLRPVRIEDVDHFAGQIAEGVLKDPIVRDELHRIAANILRSLM